ncbi:unnamed protein product [Laminaria digitata]
MEDSCKQHKQERALRAVQLAAISGFLDDNRSLQGSCHTLCNSCREYVPLQCLMIGLKVPPTLLAMFWPDLLRVGGEGASRVLPPRRVLKVNWRFKDPDTKKQDTEEKKVERGPVTACDVDMSKVRWPEGVNTINLIRFNRPVDNVVWPDSLEMLSFHVPWVEFSRTHYVSERYGIFNQPLDGVTFPADLREIFLGMHFKQCIAGVTWPEGLERLSMPGFNQPIHDVQWPSGLKSLEFIEPYELEKRDSSREVRWQYEDLGFNQPLGTFLPTSLNKLWLSDTFEQSLLGVTWPSGLAVLGLGIRVTAELIDGVAWPPYLRKMVYAGPSYDVQNVPRGCEVVTAGTYADSDVGSAEIDDHWNEDGWQGEDLDDNYDSPMSDFSL